jgi:PAS domain S-box-containing protein
MIHEMVSSDIAFLGHCVRNWHHWRSWIKTNSGVLKFLGLVLALVFLSHLLVTYTLPALMPGFANKLPDAVTSAVLLSILVGCIILPFLLRLNRRAQIAEKSIASTNDGYWVLNSDGAFIDVNPGYCRMLGYSRDKLMSMTIADLEEVATLPQIQAQIRRIIAKGHERFETRHRHRNGQWVDLEIAVTGVDDRYLIAFLRDISERKVTDLALREVTRIAEAANQAKSEFLANMSHEIRTPMNGVMGMTELAISLATNAEQRTYLNTALGSAQSLMVILNEILDFSKIEAGQMQIESVPFDLHQMVQECLTGVEVRTRAKGLTLARMLAPGLPRQVLGDPGRIRQVLNNLCDNAIKFTHQGGLKVQIQLHGDALTGYEAQLSVTDTGVGITADKQEAIFDAFSQADASTTRQFGGTGLGLTICTRLVELMGGRIWVESAVGTGSTFHFTARLGLVAPLAETSLKDEPVATAVTPRQLSVLLVEDHPVNQMLVIALLKKWNHQVVLAKNGQEAVDIFSSRLWDIVLMDIQMPVMGGMEATTLIRAQESPHQRVPIVAITASAMEADREACRLAGMDDHMAKPFNAAGLEAVLARHCPSPVAAH